MKREAFMMRVRAALAPEPPPERPPERPPEPRPEPRPEPGPPPDVDEAIMRLAPADGDLVAAYAARAEAVGMHVHRTTESDLTSALGEVIETLAARTATVGLADDADAQHVHAALADARCTVVDWRGSPGISAHYDVDVGITDVQAAFAETGTVVIASDAAHSRGTFIAPPVHVAIVRAADIVPDMIDYWNKHPRPGASGAATVFVTGPSKTADIEGILITGVHGPRAVHVLLVE